MSGITKRFYRLVHDEARRRAANDCIQAPDGYVVTVSKPTRSLDQNAAQWPILEAISRQIQWPVNGKMEWLTDEEFKDVLTAAFKGEQMRLAQGVNGGVVMLGLRTSQMKKDEFSEWLEYLNWFCAEKGISLVPRAECERQSA